MYKAPGSHLKKLSHWNLRNFIPHLKHCISCHVVHQDWTQTTLGPSLGLRAAPKPILYTGLRVALGPKTVWGQCWHAVDCWHQSQSAPGLVWDMELSRTGADNQMIVSTGLRGPVLDLGVSLADADNQIKALIWNTTCYIFNLRHQTNQPQRWPLFMEHYYGCLAILWCYKLAEHMVHCNFWND